MFKGLIDEVRVYNRPLSDAEVAELYEMEKQQSNVAFPQLSISKSKLQAGETQVIKGNDFPKKQGNTDKYPNTKSRIGYIRHYQR